MIKLKTLKDILSPDNDWAETSRKKCGELLKAEAVKWAKEFKRQRDWSRHNIRTAYWDGKMQVLMDFFNLTEEDLK